MNTGNKSLLFVFEPFRTILEEIVFQRSADLEEQWHGEPLGAEGLVDVLGCAVHLLGQPDGCAALPFQLGLDQSAEM